MLVAGIGEQLINERGHGLVRNSSTTEDDATLGTIAGQPGKERHR